MTEFKFPDPLSLTDCIVREDDDRAMKTEPQTDIVARLRFTHKYSNFSAIHTKIAYMLATLPEAAAEIERLRAEIEQLKQETGR